MDKLKQFWGWIVGAVGFIIAALIYYLNLKNKQVNSLKAQIDLADTSNKVTQLETEIKHQRNEVATNLKEIKELDKTLAVLEEKKVVMAKEAGAKTPQEVEDFWSKN